MKIFIDDERMPLRDEIGEWIIVREPKTAIDLIRANAPFVTHLSFDNDLGFELEGDDVMKALFGTPMTAPVRLPVLQEIRVHSANIVKNKAMIDRAVSARDAGVIGADVHIEARSALYERYQLLEHFIDMRPELFEDA